MNRSMLILVCDFLLVSMLSLANFDRPSDLDQRRDASMVEVREADPGAAVDADLVAAMQQALADEAARRAALAAALEATQTDLSRREEALRETRDRLDTTTRTAAELAAERERLEAARTELGTRVEATREELAVHRERLRGTEEQLRAREAELAAAAERLSQAAENQRALDAARQEAEAEIRIREAEKRILEQNLVTAQTEIEMVRQERVVLQRQTERLSAEVGRLADTSAAVEQTIRESTVISSNIIFDRWQRQRATLSFTGQSSRFGRPRETTTEALLVSDGTDTWALAHGADTPFQLGANAGGWLRVDGTITFTSAAAGTDTHPVTDVNFLAADPRILAIRVPAAILERHGLTAAAVTSDPLRFPQAVLLSPGSGRYGELNFRLVAERPQYLRMDNRLVTRLFGEFSPSRSDLVFTQGGEFLGLMVTNSHAVQVPHFDVILRIPLASEYQPGRSDAQLQALTRRVAALPSEVR